MPGRSSELRSTAIHLTSLGETLHKLMALDGIPTDETDEIIPELRGPRPVIKERPLRPSQRRQSAS